MAIIGIGTDIVEIARIQVQLDKSLRLAERVLTENELMEFEKQKFKARFLAKRFAAKEAMVKAAGCGIGQGIGFTQMEIRHFDSGQPYLFLSGNLLTHCQSMGMTSSYISIADEQRYAVATVVLERG
ncbi:holo-ACP synthase [Bowmanella dokdonensis]|uniref:Holo-[acyl-carrier-protein] synthase n=1 Tax=Bowmanella dokdonensis TaxID=751969 RepID=A0A939DPE8_9ALTE|nr:holo-ACP synthase [Bowmanella dokdonensis]MBN7826534.1 holo-ACP synthase [Bowmanella dokdonensis]